MDDIVTGADNEEEDYLLYQKSKSMLREGGFNLHKFVTSSKSLQAQIDHDEFQFISNSDNDDTYAKSTLGSHEMLHPG